MYNNWEDIKCQNSNFYIAPIFGKNSSQTFDECTRQIETDIINAELNPINNKVDNVDTKIMAIKQKLDDTIKQTSNMNSQTNQGVLNLSTTIQQNIMNVKNALSKILGSIVLSTYMTNGVIQSSQNLGNNVLTDVVTNFNNALNAEQQMADSKGTLAGYSIDN